MSTPPPSPSCTELLDTLFRERRRPDGREYSYAEVSRIIKERYNGYLAPSYLGKLRNGQAGNPSRDVIIMLCRFFGINPTYFFPELPSELLIQPEETDITIEALLEQYGLNTTLATHIAHFVDVIGQAQQTPWDGTKST